MLLKEVYNKDFLEALSSNISKLDKSFNSTKFLKLHAKESWQEMSLKERMRSISLHLNDCFVDKSYAEKIAILSKIAPQISGHKHNSLAMIILPDFVENFGLSDFDLSMQALEFFTEFGSSEFAVRQFLKKDQKRALKKFDDWTKNSNHHIRRLASEGCRPGLPWGEALNDFKKDPSPVLKILEKLKFDKSRYVQKSVANNLNDISKDHPQLVISLMQNWQKEQVDQWLIKHALRTLLKKGNVEALKIIGVKKPNLSKDFTIRAFSLQKSQIKLGEELVFDLTFENHQQDCKIRLEYGIYFVKQNSSHSKKVFQITTKNFPQGIFSFRKKHSFRDLTTRKHYVGKHIISLIINGIEIQKIQFDLKND